jgi:hypothetical protein
VIQIAFAGHNRPHDLGPPKRISAALAAAFEMIRAAGVDEALLLTGLAAGADELAAEAWRQAGLGGIHAVFPFLDDAPRAKVEFDGMTVTNTWLDGAAAEAQGRNPHLKQTRMIVEAADLVVVVWTGEPAKGAGGTADAVLCALELNLPVLWIQPTRAHPIRLIRPERLPSDFHFPEFQEALHRGRLDHVEIATPEILRNVFDGAPRHADASGEHAHRRRSGIDDALHNTVWKTYRAFRRHVGGRVKVDTPDVTVPPSLQVQPGFQLLSAAHVSADHIANRLSSVHRSEQVLLVLTMIAAAIVGSAPSIWPEFKVTAVWIELGLSVAALLVWATASDRRQHELWSRERHRAERLRLERAGWVIGIGVAGAMAGPPGSRSSHVRPAARAGLPSGRFDGERVQSWGAWAMGELVYGQAGYHRAVSAVEGRIAHRIHWIEDVSFLFLFAVFTLYVALHATASDAHFPAWISGFVAMTGTIVPALAAASIALEAKLEFQEQSARSRRIAATLDSLGEELGPTPSLDALQDVGRIAMRLHMAEVSRWQDGTDRRQLLRA